jgi:uncharacterized circularly permuted ATP-grasp superfamily protein
MWLLDNQSPSGSDMLLKIELLWQMFSATNKNIHRAKLSPYFTELKKRLENLVAVLKIQMWFLSPGAGNETLSMFIFLPLRV